MQIPATQRIRRYELTILVPGSFASDKITEARNSVAALLKKHGFTTVSQDEWGKKGLAYPIKHASKKEVEASYFHMLIEASSEKVSPLDTDLKLNQHVMRYLLVLEEKQQPMPASAAVVEEVAQQE